MKTQTERGDKDGRTSLEAFAISPDAPAKENDPDLDPRYDRSILKFGQIELVIEPARVRNWEEFKLNTPPFSIALDGYVSGLQEPDLSRHAAKANFNHHEGVLRSATSSTSLQVFEAIKEGLFKTFKKDGEPYARVYVNDCDPDTCLAIWLLSHASQIDGSNNDVLLEELLRVEDRMDRFAGAYPLDSEHPLVEKLAWVFDPYYQVRAKIQKMGAESMAQVILDVCNRISETAAGSGGGLAPAAGYKSISEIIPDLDAKPAGWEFIAEEQPFARMRMAADGKQSFISLISKDNGISRYTVGKFGSYVPVDIDARYKIFNAAELIKGNLIDDHNRWGGSNTIGGSPRRTGSLLSVIDLVRINNRLTELEIQGLLTQPMLCAFIEMELPKLLA